MAGSKYEIIIKAVDQSAAPIRKVEKALVGVDKKTKKVNKSLKKTNSRFKDFGKKGVKGLGALTKGLGAAAIAATAAAGAFAYMAKSTLNTLDALGKTASKLGVTTEFLSKYQVIANRAGISTETFNMGLQRFLRRLGEAQQGTGELLKPLGNLGISMKDANGNFREGTKVFAEYMKKLSGMENSTQKLAFAMKGFDSEGVAMVNIADMGADRIAELGRRAKEAGLIISGDLAIAAAAANDALADLFDLGKGFKTQFFGALSQTIEQLTEMLRGKLILEINAGGGMKALANDLAAAFLEGTSTFITAFAGFVDDFRNAFATFTNILKQIVVSISKIPGVGFDATFDIGKPQLELNLSDAKQKLAEFDSWVDGLSAWQRLDKGVFVWAEGGRLEKDIKTAEQALQSLADGSLIAFERMATDSTAASDAIVSTTNAIDGQAEKLRTIAEKERIITQLRKDYPVYEDRILRLAKAQGKVAEETDNATTETKKFAVAIQQSTSGRIVAQIKQEAHNLRELKLALAAVSDISRHTGISVAQLTEEFTKQIEAITGTDEATKKLNKTWKTTASGGIIGSLVNDTKELAELHKTLAAAGDIASITGQPLALVQASIQEKIDSINSRRRNLLGQDEEGELTFQQQMIETYKSTHTELALIEEALGNVSAMAREAGISEAFLTEELKKQQETLRSQVGLYETKVTSIADVFERGFGKMANSIGDELASAIVSGENMLDSLGNAFKRTMDGILQEILASQINALLYQMFNIGPGGGGPGGAGINWMGLFTGGAKAAGGPVTGGKSYLTGENGVERFTAPSNGYITSNGKLGNQNGGELVVNFNINAIDSRSGTEFILENKKQITSVIQEAYNRRGKQGIY